MNKSKNQKGITIMALIFSIIIILVIVSVAIWQVMKMVNKEENATMETNMYSIKVKVKEHAENVDAKNWDISTSSKKGVSKKEKANRKELQSKYFYTLIDDASQYNNYYDWYIDTDNYTYYALEEKALEKMGLEDLWDGSVKYIVKYPLEDGNIKDLQLDIIYIDGVVVQENTYYELSKLQEIL